MSLLAVAKVVVVGITECEGVCWKMGKDTSDKKGTTYANSQRSTAAGWV